MKKFGKNDIFVNTLKTYPKQNFFIYDGKIYLNNDIGDVGQNQNPANHVPVGHVNLYELNVDRTAGNLIYPFVSKNSTRTRLKTISKTAFNNDFVYGDTISGSYPMSASLTIAQYLNDGACGLTRPQIVALRNTINHYRIWSPHFQFSSSYGDKETQDLTFVDIPSIFFGSSIKKGSVQMTFNVSGSRIGELRDLYRNGELIETTGSSTGSVAGIVLYNEGAVLLTGSWNLLASHTERYKYCTNETDNPRWKYFGSTVNGADVNRRTVSSSYEFNFNGVQKIQKLTMLCHALENEFNHSNNQTYVKFSENIHQENTGSKSGYNEMEKEIFNFSKSDYVSPTSSFEKITYISQVGIYDSEKNLIALAKFARPLKKTEKRSFVVKLGYDLI